MLTIDLLETFGRHFLAWINRWQAEGVEPVQKAWLSRATGLGKPVEVRVGDHLRAGTFEGLTETGAMRLVKDGVAQTVPLDEAMRVPTWSVLREGRTCAISGVRRVYHLRAPDAAGRLTVRARSGRGSGSTIRAGSGTLASTPRRARS